MSCILRQDNNRKFAVLGFKRDQLLYDIKNYAFIEGSVMDRSTDDHIRHVVQDVGEEGNEDRISRVLNLAVAKCREILYPYTKHGIEQTELDDTLKEPKVYGIMLSLPSGFSQTTLNLVGELVHEYIVCTAVADWMSITNPGKAEVWLTKANMAESEITTSLNTRSNRTRVRMHPF